MSSFDESRLAKPSDWDDLSKIDEADFAAEMETQVNDAFLEAKLEVEQARAEKERLKAEKKAKKKAAEEAARAIADFEAKPSSEESAV